MTCQATGSPDEGVLSTALITKDWQPKKHTIESDTKQAFSSV